MHITVSYTVQSGVIFFFLDEILQKQFLSELGWTFYCGTVCYALKISFNYKFETENEFLKKCLLKCKLQAILTMQDCRVVLSQIGSMFNIPELYGAFAFPSLRIDSVAWPFE